MATKRNGIFITFEGGEGSGKSTQIRTLSKWLKQQGFQVIVSLEPGGTPVGKHIRRTLLNPNFKNLSSRAELLLYEADRAQHVDEVVLPQLSRGKVVISDRHADSSTVYQGICRRLGVNWTLKLNSFATLGLLPDLTIVLDVPERIGRGRLQKRKSLDRLERERRSFHQQVRRGFLLLAKKEPRRIVIVDATQSVSEVGMEIRKQVSRILGGRWKRR